MKKSIQDQQKYTKEYQKAVALNQSTEIDVEGRAIPKDIGQIDWNTEYSQRFFIDGVEIPKFTREYMDSKCKESRRLETKAPKVIKKVDYTDTDNHYQSPEEYDAELEKMRLEYIEAEQQKNNIN